MNLTWTKKDNLLELWRHRKRTLRVVCSYILPVGVYKYFWPPLGRELGVGTICRVLKPGPHYNALVSVTNSFDIRFGYNFYMAQSITGEGWWEEDLEIVYERD